MRAAALIPALALLAGSAVGLAWPALPPEGLVALLTAGLAVAVWAFVAERPRILAVAVAAGFGAGGALLAADAWRAASRPPLLRFFEETRREEEPRAERGAGALADGVLVELAGVLRSDAAPGPDGVRMALEVRAIRRVGSAGGARFETTDRSMRGGVQLFVAGEIERGRAASWRAGRTLRLVAHLRPPVRYLNPGAADGTRALARRGIVLVGTVKSPALVEVEARGSRLEEAASAARAWVRRALQAAIGRWSDRSAAIVTAILIGDRTGLDPQLETRLQEAGTYHVIAISGGNIAILAGLMLIGFRLAGALGRGAMLTAAVGLLGYGYLAAGGSSVARATLMALVFFAGRAVDLRGPPVNALAVAAGLLVAADPLTVRDAGFLLTFGATAGILLLVPVLTARLPSARPVRLAATMAAASAAAELALMPVGALLFSRVTLAGLVLNFVAIPLMAMAQIAGMAALPAGSVLPAAGLAAGWFAHLGAEGLVRSADLVRIVPVLSWRVAPPHALAVVLYYTALSVAVLVWHTHERAGSALRVPRAVRRLPHLAAAVAASWMLFEPWTLAAARGDGRLRVTFLDVGQGDATLVRFPRGSTLLVDAGGLSSSPAFDIGDRVVAAALRHYGIRRLDRLTITHGDADHAGGAPAVVREFRPRSLWEGVPVPRLDLLRAVRTGAAEAGGSVMTVAAGTTALVDGVLIRVLHPPPPDWERQQVRNDDSIVLDVRWQDVSVVLAGDIGREIERLLLPAFDDVPIRVVKVPHHGSLTSSSAEFVRALAPRAAVVSAGRGNRFGHPAPAVLARYREAGADIFRTDHDGAVELETDGRTVEIRAFEGRMATLLP